MKRFAILATGLALSVLGYGMRAYAFGDRINAGCSISSTNPTAAATSSDSADCKWGANTALEVQCTTAWYMAGGGATATTDHDKYSVGDPVTVVTLYENEVFSVLAVAGSTTCDFKKKRPEPRGL